MVTSGPVWHGCVAARHGGHACSSSSDGRRTADGGGTAGPPDAHPGGAGDGAQVPAESLAASHRQGRTNMGSLIGEVSD